MKLTEKDKDFLDALKALLEERQLRILLRERVTDGFVLRQNYGDRIERAFGMTRQGVRWRFQRLMDMYVSAYETVLFVESNLGTHLRRDAMAVAQARAALRRRVQEQAAPKGRDGSW